MWETKDYWSLGIGGAGLILSGAIWIRTLWSERRHVEVSVSPTYFQFGDGEISSQMASINVINRGKRPVSVKAPTLRMPNGQHLIFIGIPDFGKFPKRLEDGEAASLCATFDEISTRLKKEGYTGTVKLRPCCVDATETQYSGKRWRLNVSKDWTKRHISKR